MLPERAELTPTEGSWGQLVCEGKDVPALGETEISMA